MARRGPVAHSSALQPEWRGRVLCPPPLQCPAASTIGVGSRLALRHEPQLFRSKRPVNRALGFCHSLGFDGSSSPYGNACVERDRPFPHVPSNALNDAILDAAIFHVVHVRFVPLWQSLSLCLRPSVCRAQTGAFQSSDPHTKSPDLPNYIGGSLRASASSLAAISSSSCSLAALIFSFAFSSPLFLPHVSCPAKDQFLSENGTSPETSLSGKSVAGSGIL